MVILDDLPIKHYMICDDLWWFMMIYDDLWWFMMIYLYNKKNVILDDSPRLHSNQFKSPPRRWKSELCTSFPAQAISLGHRRTASSGELLVIHYSWLAMNS